MTPPVKNTTRRTRIVATLGPATDSKEMIGRLLIAGVNVFRLNFSHGDQDLHRQTVANIRAVSEEFDIPVGILQDLQGPKIRVGRFEKDKVTLKEGARFDLTASDDSPGTQERVGVTYRG